MATKIQVTPEELDKAAKIIENLATDYQNLYTQFYKETDDMGTSWKGEDNQAYIGRINEFKTDFDDMFGLMIKYVEFLRTTANAYRDTQNDIITQTKNLVIDA